MSNDANDTVEILLGLIRIIERLQAENAELRRTQVVTVPQHYTVQSETWPKPIVTCKAGDAE